MGCPEELPELKDFMKCSHVRHVHNAPLLRGVPTLVPYSLRRLGDHPDINKSHNMVEVSYGGVAKSHFQKIIRRQSGVEAPRHGNMEPITETRIEWFKFYDF